MLQNNRLQIFLSIKNPYDYAEFKAVCEREAVTPIPWVEYAQKAQTVMHGMKKYPDLSPQDAYLKLVADNNGHLAIDPPAPQDSCCDAPPQVSTLDQIKSAGLSVAKWAGAGAPVLDKTSRGARMDICQNCAIDHEPMLVNGRCRTDKGGCGCFVAIKTWMTTESCPKGKW